MPHQEVEITIPVLVAADSENAYRQFCAAAQFRPGDTKFIRDVLDLHGWKDKVLLMVGYPPDRGKIIEYAKYHGIRVVLT